MVLPEATPVTTPVLLTVAAAGFDDVQVPPPAADVREMVLPAHTVAGPVTESAGVPSTVTVVEE